MLLNLNFNHLYYFYVVGRAQGLTEAAKLLRISQPSLSSQMKILEGRLGVALFKKVGRRALLTPEGHRVLQMCEKMFLVAENLERELNSNPQNQKIVIRLAVSADIERPFAVDVISRAFLKDRRIRVQLLSGTEDTVLRDLRIGTVDFALSTTPLFGDSIRVLAECDLPVVAGIAKKSLLGGKRPASLKDLPNRWIAPGPQQKLRREADSYFEKKRLSPQIQFESDVMGALIRAITDGLGWGLFPKAYLRHESQSRNLAILGPPEGFWKHRLYLLSPSSGSVPAEFGKLLTGALRVECDS